MMIQEETYNLPYDSKVNITQKLLKTITSLMLKNGISSFFGLYLTEYKEFGLELIYLKVDI